MPFEIDFLPVGNGEKSGDAIALRFGKELISGKDQFVVAIDGGTLESGESLANHIKKYYKTTTVNLLISTHPDNDHSSGLRYIANEMDVKEIWMHLPWRHSKECLEYVQDARVTERSLRTRLQESLNTVGELEELAEEKGIPIKEPFSDNPDTNYKNIIVLSPSTAFYEQLLSCFKAAPESFDEAPEGLLQKFISTIKTLLESWAEEGLEDPAPNASTAENNSATIIYLDLDDHKILLTSDTGTPALTEAIKRADELGINLKECYLYQVPHHGSKRNCGPTVLNSIIGTPVPENQSASTKAIISVSPKGEPKHPSKKVVNAFIRRGCLVCATKGKIIRYSHNAPEREGWGPATPLAFDSNIDEQED